MSSRVTLRVTELWNVVLERENDRNSRTVGSCLEIVLVKKLNERILPKYCRGGEEERRSEDKF